MQVNITRKAVLAHAKKLINTKSMTHAAALELISKFLGQPDWKSLSALLPDSTRESDDPSKPWSVFGWTEAPVTVSPHSFYVEASATDKLNASYGLIHIDNTFMEMLHELQTQVLTKKLESAAKVCYLDFDTDGEFDLHCHRIVGTDTDFWFEAYPAHLEGAVQTCAINIADFIEVQSLFCKRRSL